MLDQRIVRGHGITMFQTRVDAKDAGGAMSEDVPWLSELVHHSGSLRKHTILQEHSLSVIIQLGYPSGKVTRYDRTLIQYDRGGEHLELGCRFKQLHRPPFGGATADVTLMRTRARVDGSALYAASKCEHDAAQM